MKELNITLNNPTGLHARPAKTLVNLVKQFSAEITVSHQGKTVNGKSLISLLTLGAECGAQILIEVEGVDEEATFNAIKTCIETGLLEG